MASTAITLGELTRGGYESVVEHLELTTHHNDRLAPVF
jgi:hypothetical protein